MTYTQLKAAELLAIASETTDIEVAQAIADEFLRRKQNRLTKVADYKADPKKSADAVAAQERMAERNQTNHEVVMTFVAALTPAKARKPRVAAAKAAPSDEVAELKAQVATLHTMLQKLVDG